MVKFNNRRITTILLTTYIAMGIAGCNNSELMVSNTIGQIVSEEVEMNKEIVNSEVTDVRSDGESDEYIHISILGVGNEVFEEEKSAVIKEIADQTGVFAQANWMPEEKISVMMASRDLNADIILPSENSTMNMERLVEEELVLALDNLIETNGQDIKENIPKTLEFYKKYRSNGNNKVYFLSSHNTPDIEALKQSKQYNFQIAPYIRWDYYKELGSPAIYSEDDLLNVLKQMQDNHPTTKEGKKTYAMTLNLESPLWSYYTMYGYMNDRELLDGYVVSRDSKGEIRENILETDHITWRAAAYYNKAYRLGIFDPESFTQKGQNVEEKCENEQAFYTENSWNNYNAVLAETVGAEAGFEPILTAFPTVYAGSYSAYGWTFTTAISASAQNSEAAMKWLNYLYTPKGARTIYSGVEGVHWQYDVDKVPRLNEETLEMINNEEWNKVSGIKQYANWVGIDNSAIHTDGYPVDLFSVPETMTEYKLAIDNKYCEENGVIIPYEVGLKMQEEGNLKVVWWSEEEKLLIPQMPDDIKKISMKINDTLVKAMPRLIMANSEEEFENIKSEVIEYIGSIGGQAVINWIITEYTKVN